MSISKTSIDTKRSVAPEIRIIGSIHVYRNNLTLFYIIILYVLYFLIITGPVLSPKYIFPILPCIFLFQGITFFKIIHYFKIKLT